LHRLKAQDFKSFLLYENNRHWWGIHRHQAKLVRDMDLLRSDTGRDDYPARETTADDVALIHFTSGTTGQPKGAVHTHQAALNHYVSARYALDLHPGDVYWCTADPGWVTGVSYGIIAPPRL